jgi:anti-sigma regulatory factor (Ser/Thr protein kinase)
MSPRAEDDRGNPRNVLTLEPSLASSRRAREHVARFVAGEHLNGGTDDLNIIVGELVANAVMHGRAPIALMLSCRAGKVLVEVSDGASDLDAVRFRDIDAPQFGGRGLRILAALVDEWGIAANAKGKTVWAVYVISRDPAAPSWISPA